MSNASVLRARYLEAVKADLLGPVGGLREQLIKERPSDRYLTGILYPDQLPAVRDEVTAEDDDDRDEATNDDEGSNAPIPMNSMRRPSSIGISFNMHGESIRLEGTAARYRRRWLADGSVVDVDSGREHECWVREPIAFTREVIVEVGRLREYVASEGLRWWVRAVQSGPTLQVTVVLENTLAAVPGRVELEQASFFQGAFRVTAGDGSCLVPRRPVLSAPAAPDDDMATNSLIYRNMEEWAVGHTCAATWGDADGQRFVETTWLPEQLVPSMTADGHEKFAEHSRLATGEGGSAFLAQRLADANKQELNTLLAVTPAAYREWLEEQRGNLAGLAPDEGVQAQKNLARADEAAQRIENGIQALLADDVTMHAFQLAQGAMQLQRKWAGEKDLQWRPFQIAFQLLAIPGLVSALDSEGKPSLERLRMDLLWFPTGGGKTEAYLGLVAFVLFHRRLRSAPHPDNGAGVAAIMRYTLRLLTVQQFERGSRMVLACEFLRRKAGATGDHRLGSIPFSIGLWVGRDATPNSVKDARSSEDEASKARQLTRCPACQHRELAWDSDAPGPYVLRCRNEACPLAGQPLPVHTIDEVVYSARPSLLIGTVDKFAQIVRKEESGALLGADGAPPDLILQDELHLISGPLGTMVGLYEAAIDQICSRNGVPPKVIGSTATIRRAQEQVRALFDREVSQFPPPAIDWEDSCFAVRDRAAPGRLYLGVTTAGRSPKFTLQATCAALMQRVAPGEGLLSTDHERDPYWTLLAYFNSMRELGGALVMMLDDVNDSMGVYARSHGCAVRTRVDEPLELTSRVPSAEIPEVLERLEQKLPDQDVSVVLATNMISVGVDIPRLGLMVINGQPKSMAEYIQASSRVGRNQVPGVIVTVYNAGRTRDRAHYESFRTWHQALYREVEATSVTPFAPRARDKALHAAVVGIARHLVAGMRSSAELTPSRREELEPCVQALCERAASCDPGEADETRQQITAFLDMWAARGDLKYWDDHRPAQSLLVSAEKAAEARASSGAWGHASKPTPNSMREVEPSVRFRMTTALSRTQSVAAEPAAPSPEETSNGD